MATLTKQVDNLNKRVVALENSELEASDAVPFIVKLYADFEVSPVIECGDGGYSSDKMELIINGAVKEVTNKIANGDFSQGTTGWTPSSSSSIAVSSRILSITGTGLGTSPLADRNLNLNFVLGDKWFFYSKVRVTNTVATAVSMQIRYTGGSILTKSQSNPLQNQWYELYEIATAVTGNSASIRLFNVYPDAATANGKIMEVEGWNGETANAGIYAINLTAEFGAGNEPTAAQMKAAIDEYRARTYPECSEDTELTAGAQGAAEELSTKINYSAVGTGIVPAPGTIGMPDEAARKPVGTVTTVESSETETVIVFSSFFDEQAANGETLTSAAVLYDATDSIGTGAVVASEAINIEKTSAKTLTVSAEITITEVV